MQFDATQLIPVLPEISLLTLACLVLLVDLFIREEQRIASYVITQVGLLVTVAVTLAVASSETQILFDGSYIRDPMSDLLKVGVLLVTFISFLYAKDYLIQRDLFKGEFYTLGLFAVLGMTVMISANSFLTIYLGLELLALCLYALVAFNRDSPEGAEAAMKYFVLGALASGMLLYGISMIYGTTGTLQFDELAKVVSKGDMNEIVMIFGIVFLVIGLAFKLGAVPFHMWVPDVYHGAPTAVVAFLASAPKIAAFALAMRLLVDGLAELNGGWQGWQGMLIILAVLSMGVGNLIAIAQTNIKRMLAYSTISHVGFIMLGILAGTKEGYTAAMFYTLVYALMSAGAFGIIIALSRKGFEAENLDDMKGLNQRNPWFAGMMLLLMFSMAGVPPTVGFFAKLFVLDAVVSVDLTWLALVGVAFSIIGAFYYIRVVKLIYFDQPEDETPLSIGVDTQVMLSINGLSMLVLGLFPAGLLSLCAAAIGS
ncbi:MAG: NADH-quinone oxidoreductase subunit NuoN [Candidatus Thiodiazotropha lotti]|uniref:NADH-quinone oxidoreductase subunit N n=1 Tax=Candidatus Thiodiazotropha endoloripes TaxID=1818881 RepID=A0A1E2UI99_9GAMM|nr:NADH-quinone oxidoreductase subunit NuoN [Candidatus Thiodiazotropha endoloripes]MCG7899582.1 NADH-quinone oxidoreductase subunit NuoN [Candidatus Thiodiazotropha weberae]MCG7992673.1 NADH-quinone oxidoreductase subunit NuoN [Candidatus Thiodiazotropha lotti]MCG7901879.1 NADH-quinone oxidoreductase subunit NuoN [Candidatus Thiodiazotropha weberae]MCG7912254.1 NADH-quinone oxidoreductase subunit NuoN [Candidatus Thiodiazotropha weberae]MCG7998738.1 NADH-quinone oxidoreductase subunit NuoN [C